MITIPIQDYVPMLSPIAVYSGAGKYLKTPQNTSKRSKTPQNAVKCRKTPQILQIGDKSSRDQIFGGGEKPRPLLGGEGPLSPLKIFFLVSSRPVTKPTYDEIQKKAKKNSVGCKHRHYSERPFFLFFAETVVCPFMARDHLGKLGWKNKFRY